MARNGWQFSVHRERAESLAMHAFATQMLQCWKGVDYRKKVVEVPECDPRDEEAGGGFEYREKEWEAEMKREVL